MKKAKNISAMILFSAMLCCLGGVLAGCEINPASNREEETSFEENKDSVKDDSVYIKDDVYASDFYLTQYEISCVRDVFRDPSMPSASDTSLRIHNPRNPCIPDYYSYYDYRYTDAELANIKYFVLKKSSQKDRYDEYAVFTTGAEQKIGSEGRIMCFGKEGFLYLCGGPYGTYYGTFFFTKYGYEKFKSNNYDMTYNFYKLNLGHNDIAEIFGSAN